MPNYGFAIPAIQAILRESAPQLRTNSSLQNGAQNKRFNIAFESAP